MTNSRRTSRGPVTDRGLAVEKHWFKEPKWQYWWCLPMQIHTPSVTPWHVQQKEISQSNYWWVWRMCKDVPASLAAKPGWDEISLCPEGGGGHIVLNRGRVTLLHNIGS